MTPIFSNKSRLLTSTMPRALMGIGVPGSKYAEFQPSDKVWVTPPPDEIAADIAGLMDDATRG